jgi:outer membrane protein TolC
MLAFVACQAGCGTTPSHQARLLDFPESGSHPSALDARAEGVPPALIDPPAGDGAVLLAAYPDEKGKEGKDQPEMLPPPRKLTEKPEEPPTPSKLPAGPSLFGGLKELTAEALVVQVLARNPSVAEMVSAWKAASARFPQVTSLDDPMLGLQAAPATWFDKTVDGGVRVEVSQKYPWHGKLELRGENALAQAGAAGFEVADVQLQLIESARRAFYDYYLVDRALAVNRENLRLLRQFEANAEKRYTAGLASQQDVLQAGVEIGRAQERQVTLERLRPVAVARINTLLYLQPDAPLPPPPSRLELGEGPPDAAALHAAALQQRPDLRAVAERIKAEEASLALAQKEFYPDYELMAAYDTLWQEKPLRAQVGVRLNLPVRQERRYAAVAEAKARVGQRHAELARLTAQASYQVQQAYEQVRESEQVTRLYEKTILPVARLNVKAAQSAYVAGKIPFLSLVEAQRNVVGLQDRYYEALADYFRRRATLDRVVGGPLLVAGPAAPGAPAQPPGPPCVLIPEPIRRPGD